MVRLRLSYREKNRSLSCLTLPWAQAIAMSYLAPAVETRKTATSKQQPRLPPLQSFTINIVYGTKATPLKGGMGGRYCWTQTGWKVCMSRLSYLWGRRSAFLGERREGFSTGKPLYFDPKTSCQTHSAAAELNKGKGTVHILITMYQ